MKEEEPQEWSQGRQSLRDHNIEIPSPNSETRTPSSHTHIMLRICKHLHFTWATIFLLNLNIKNKQFFLKEDNLHSSYSSWTWLSWLRVALKSASKCCMSQIPGSLCLSLSNVSWNDTQIKTESENMKPHAQQKHYARQKKSSQKGT